MDDSRADWGRNEYVDGFERTVRLDEDNYRETVFTRLSLSVCTIEVRPGSDRYSGRKDINATRVSLSVWGKRE